ncbi:MAG: GNAT family N-acetyltransferase [Lachnospiraceae bacterium]|nr:GNAT family N-acetyltransferase [Lachnospiraceae bacterium]
MTEKVRLLEEIGANGHVALNVLQYDGWLLRFSNGYTSRANSVCVLYSSTKPVEEKIAYCEKCYAGQGLPTIFKVTDQDQEFSDLLLKRGYEVVTPTDVMETAAWDAAGESVCLENVGQANGGCGEARCVFSSEPSKWLPYYFAFENLTDETKKNTFQKMLSKVMIDAAYGILYFEGEPVACASIAVERGYALLHNVIVTSVMRGKGLGEKLCRAMISKAKEMGAEHVFLQVVQSNQVAMNLYQKLGFQKKYTYWYMKKA